MKAGRPKELVASVRFGIRINADTKMALQKLYRESGKNWDGFMTDMMRAYSGQHHDDIVNQATLNMIRNYARETREAVMLLVKSDPYLPTDPAQMENLVKAGSRFEALIRKKGNGKL